MKNSSTPVLAKPCYFQFGASAIETGELSIAFYEQFVEEYRFFPNNDVLWTGQELAKLIQKMEIQCITISDLMELRRAINVISTYKQLYLRLTGKQFKMNDFYNV